MKQLEDNLQAACVEWFRFQYPHLVIFSIPNGGRRNKIEAAKLKRTGVLAGVADLCILYSDGGYPMGLFIEIKVEGRKQTDKQIEFEKRISQYGYYYHVCRSIEEFMNVVNEYLND